jgi:hypothetical protein
MLYDAIESLRTEDLWRPALWVTAANVAMFALALVAGDAIVRRFRERRVTPEPGPVSRGEVLLAGVCVALNALVAVAGLVLWREDLIALRPYGDYGPLTVAIDALVLVVVMDFAMYVFHRVGALPNAVPVRAQDTPPVREPAAPDSVRAQPHGGAGLRRHLAGRSDAVHGLH